MQVDNKQATDAANTGRIRPMAKKNTGILLKWKIWRSVPTRQRGAGKTIWNAR
jgi:hypothetical protein